MWEKLVTRFGNEIAVLVDVSLEVLHEAAGARITAVVKAFREGTLKVVSGGGGLYGHLEISAEVAKVLPPKPQRKITEFGLNGS